MASLTTAIELADSWKWIVTADGDEEFTLIFYAPWDEIYGPRGPGYRFAELGDILVTGDGTEDDRLRLTRIVADPGPSDKEGCRYEQIYTSANKSLKGKVPDLRTSWRASFSTIMEAREVANQIGSTVGDYTGTALTDTDANGDIITKTVYVPRTTYNLSFSASELNLETFTTRVGKVNSDSFFVAHRAISSGDQRIRDAEGNILFQTGSDANQWLFANFNATEVGIQNYEVYCEFWYSPLKLVSEDASKLATVYGGWNTSSISSYLTTDFKPITDTVKSLARPDATIPGRS